MIDRDFAKDQVRRLSGLSFFPNTTEALEELIAASMCAETQSVCKKAFDEILYDALRCPMPAEIRRVVLVENTRERESRYANPIRPSVPLCPICQSNGYFQQEGQFVRCLDCENGKEFPAVLLNQLNNPSGSKISSEERVRNAVRMGEILNRS